MTVEWLAAIPVVVALLVGVGGWANVRYKNETIASLKSLLEAHEAEKRDLTRQIGELTGRVNTLQSTWAGRLADDIAHKVAADVIAILGTRGGG